MTKVYEARELPPQELQERADLRLLRNAPWICTIFACNFLFWTIIIVLGLLNWSGIAALQIRIGQPFPPFLIAPELIFNVIMTLAFALAAFLAYRTQESTPIVRPVAVAFLTVMAAHAYLLYVVWDPLFIGGAGIAFYTGLAGLVLTKRRPFLVFAASNLAAAALIFPVANPAKQNEDFMALVMTTIISYAIFTSRKRADDSAVQITWKKQLRLEAGLRASEAQYRSIFENSLVGVFQCTSTGRIMLANHKLRELLGYQSTAEINQLSLIEDILVLSDKDLLRTMEQLCGAMNEEGLERTIRRSDGSTRIVRMHLRKRDAGTENGLGYDGLMLDITQRKAAEEAIRTQRDQIMHVSRMAALGEMLAGIAHEINQPLYAIENFAGASIRTLSRSQDQELDRIKNWNERIAKEAARVGEIIKRLRGLVYRAKPEFRSINVASLLEETLSVSEPMTRKCRVTTSVLIDKDVRCARADLVLIQQVLLNLIRNACDAMQGESDSPREITIRAARQGSTVEITVQDTGPGLPHLDGEDIFDAFVSTKQDGMGLGLAISRSIIEAHNGQIWGNSRDMQGTTFCVALPHAWEPQHDDQP